MSGFSPLQLLLSFVAGGLTTLSPCVLPILPLVVGSALQAHRFGPLAFAVGMILSFSGVALLVASLGEVLGADPETIRSIGAAMLVIGGGVLAIPRWSAWISTRLAPISSSAGNKLGRINAPGLWGQVAVGAGVGVIWSPCVGPLLGSALGLAAQSGGLAKAWLPVFLFGIGATVPLLGIAYGSRAHFLKNRATWMRNSERFKRILGLLLVLVGALVLSGGDKALEAKLTRILPEAWLDWAVRF